MKMGITTEPGKYPDVQQILNILGNADERDVFASCYPDYRVSKFIAAVDRLLEEERQHLVPPPSFVKASDALKGSSRNGHLIRDVISEFDLENFFEYTEVSSGKFKVVPRAYDYVQDNVIPEEMKQWRARYRKCSQVQQIFIATLVWLYQEKTKDTTWLRRVPCIWSLTDAIGILNRKGGLSIWWKLISCNHFRQLTY